jgi:hypothetical protein
MNLKRRIENLEKKERESVEMLQSRVSLTEKLMQETMNDANDKWVQLNALLKKEMEQLQGNLRDEMGKNTEELETLKSKFDDQANNEVEEVDEEEPGIALEDQLRITEQSAKAIDLLTSHLLSTVWQTCSKNTYGK